MQEEVTWKERKSKIRETIIYRIVTCTEAEDTFLNKSERVPEMKDLQGSRTKLRREQTKNQMLAPKASTLMLQLPIPPIVPKMNKTELAFQIFHHPHSQILHASQPSSTSRFLELSESKKVNQKKQREKKGEINMLQFPRNHTMKHQIIHSLTILLTHAAPIWNYSTSF